MGECGDTVKMVTLLDAKCKYDIDNSTKNINLYLCTNTT